MRKKKMEPKADEPTGPLPAEGHAKAGARQYE